MTIGQKLLVTGQIVASGYVFEPGAIVEAGSTDGGLIRIPILLGVYRLIPLTTVQQRSRVKPV